MSLREPLLLCLLSAACATAPRSSGKILGALQREHGMVKSCGTECVVLEDGASVKSAHIPYRQEFLEVSLEVGLQNVELGDKAWNRFSALVVGYDAKGEQVAQIPFAQGEGTEKFRAFVQPVHFELRLAVSYFVVRALLWNAVGQAVVRRLEVKDVPRPAAFLKVPPLQEVEDQNPIRWKRNALVGFPGRYLKPKGSQYRFARSGKITGLGTALTDWPGRADTASVGFELQRGFANRAVYRTGAAAWPELEMDAETFRGSPILSLYFRYQNGRLGAGPIQFETDGAFTETSGFAGNKLIAYGKQLEVCLPVSETKKPFVAFHNAEDSRGVLLYFPYPTELRRWYIEDYRIVGRHAPCLVVARTGEKTQITWRHSGPALSAGAATTVDRAIQVMPYRGSVKEALAEMALGRLSLVDDRDHFRSEQVSGFWDLNLGGKIYGAARRLRMSRYHPAEFASWIPGMNPLLSYGHRDGYMWGSASTSMKGIRIKPLAKTARVRDDAHRMLAFFLERGAPNGAPPNISIYRKWAANLDDPSRYRDWVFCQSWEIRLEDYGKFFDSPHITESEKSHVYSDLQRARRVYDPDSEWTWSTETPNGGLWFGYYNIPVHKEEPWIINTHLTSLLNLALFAELAEKRHAEEDVRYWESLFRRGVEGLLHAVAQPWMWRELDGNELAYAKTFDGPDKYHYFAATGWLPMITAHARRSMPGAVDALTTLNAKLLRARFVSEKHPKNCKKAWNKLLEAAPHVKEGAAPACAHRARAPLQQTAS